MSDDRSSCRKRKVNVGEKVDKKRRKKKDSPDSPFNILMETRYHTVLDAVYLFP
jgi:hypothetical protein